MLSVTTPCCKSYQYSASSREHSLFFHNWPHWLIKFIINEILKFCRLNLKLSPNSSNAYDGKLLISSPKTGTPSLPFCMLTSLLFCNPSYYYLNSADTQHKNNKLFCFEAVTSRTEEGVKCSTYAIISNCLFCEFCS